MRRGGRRVSTRRLLHLDRTTTSWRAWFVRTWRVGLPRLLLFFWGMEFLLRIPWWIACVIIQRSRVLEPLGLPASYSWLWRPMFIILRASSRGNYSCAFVLKL